MYCVNSCEDFFCAICKSAHCDVVNMEPEDKYLGICDFCQYGYHHFGLKEWW